MVRQCLLWHLLIQNLTYGNQWAKKNLYAFVDESAGFILTDNSGYILALVDSTGSSKTIVQGVTKLQKENLEKGF